MAGTSAPSGSALESEISGGAKLRYSKLKPRRGRAASDVSANQVARLHAAMVELVDEVGHEAVTIRRLVGRAGVSTRAFYKHFADLDACFVATYDLLIGRAAKTFAAQVAAGEDRADRIRSAFTVFADAVAEEPRETKFIVVAAPAAGRPVLEPIRLSIQKLGAALAEYLSGGREKDRVPPLILHGIVAGALRAARARLLAGTEDELPTIAGPITDWALSLRAQEAVELRDIHESPGGGGRRTRLTGGAERPALGDERAMILAAADRLSVDAGYEELTVPRIRAAAGLSRRSFDAQFEGVEDCFLEALALRTGRTFAAAAEEGNVQASWPAAVQSTIAGLCARIARYPEKARAVFVEVFVAGEEGLRCRERLIGEIGDHLRASAPPEQELSPLEAELSAAAVWALIHYHVAAGRTQRLPALAPTLSYLVLAPAIGARAAVEAITAEVERG